MEINIIIILRLIRNPTAPIAKIIALNPIYQFNGTINPPLQIKQPAPTQAAYCLLHAFCFFASTIAPTTAISNMSDAISNGKRNSVYNALPSTLA